MSFTNTRLSDVMVSVAKDLLEGKTKTEEFVIPEDVTKEDQSDFVVAAAAAKKAGKKKFTFKGKEFPVTIKADIPTEEKIEEAVDAKKVVDYLVKKGNNPKEAEKMVKAELAGAVKAYPNAPVAKIADYIRSVAEESDAEDGEVKNKVEVDPPLDEAKKEVKETGVAGEYVGKLKKMDSPKYEDDVEVVDNLPEEFETCADCKTEEKCMAEQKCMGKSEKKEVKETLELVPDDYLAVREAFDEFMVEGTMAQGIFSRDKAEAAAAMDALKDLMRKKLPVGRDGSRDSVEDKIYSIVFDDELFDDFWELRQEKGDQADARPLIKKRLAQLRVKV